MRLILSLLLLLSGGLKAVTLTLTGPATARPGQTVTLTLMATGSTAAAIEAFQWTLASPGTGYTLTPAIGSSAATANKSLTCSSDGTLCLEFATSAGPATAVVADGPLATIAVKVPTSGSPGIVAFNLTGLFAIAGVPAGSVPVTVGAAYSIRILDPRDVDGNGVIDLNDVTAALLQITGGAPCGTADVNGDGVCTVLDVFDIVLKILGLIP